MWDVLSSLLTQTTLQSGLPATGRDGGVDRDTDREYIQT